MELKPKHAYFMLIVTLLLSGLLTCSSRSYTITFYMNEGGAFRVNNTTVTNGTSTAYANGTVLEFAALPANASYVFNNYSWSPTWDLIDETWDSLGNWTKTGEGTSDISPSGQLHQKPISTYVGRNQILTGGLPNNFMFETRVKIDNFDQSSSHKRWAFINDIHHDFIEIYPTTIDTWNEQENMVTQEGVWYTFRLLWDSDAETMIVYRNNVFIRNFTIMHLRGIGQDGDIGTYDYTGSESHEDYFQLASGLHAPPINSTSNPYNFTVLSNVTVWCYFDSAPTYTSAILVVSLFLLIPVVAVLFVWRFKK